MREQVARLLRHQGEGARRLPPILILGETSTGKGLLAHLLHRAGPRATGPLATRTGSRKSLVKAWRLTGEIATQERRWDEAEAARRQALALADAIANPPSSGRPTRRSGASTRPGGSATPPPGPRRGRARPWTASAPTLVNPALRRSLRDPVPVV